MDVAVAPDGKHLFVADVVWNASPRTRSTRPPALRASAFVRDAAIGALTPVPGGPFAKGFGAQTFAITP